MAFPKSASPKIQRGISLPPELHKRIQEDADRLGLRWNDVVERVLRRAFSVPGDGKNQQENRNGLPELVLKEVPDDDD